MGCGDSPSALESTSPTDQIANVAGGLNLGPSVLVANRDSATVSVVDVATDVVTHTIVLPPGANTPSASYVSYSVRQDQIFVGDDSNSRILVYDASNLVLLDELSMPSDVFHIWNNGEQLWAVDRTAKSLLVFDLAQRTQLASISIPADLRSAGGAPHDVVVDSDAAYVTVAEVNGAPDVLLKYSTRTFSEIGRQSVGEDPHVILHPTDRRVFVACQDTDNLFILNRDTMNQENVVPLLGGHGVWIPSHGEALYVTNFPSHLTPGTPGPGARGLYVVDLNSETESGSVETATRAHNLTSSSNGNKLYLTHTNGGTSVTVFDTSNPDRLPRNPREITVGDNPFGLTFMP